MTQDLKIYIDRLQNGHVEKIDSLINIKDLDIEEEKELLFSSPVQITGKTYIAEEDIIVNLNIKFTVKLPCKICNELSEIPVEIDNFYHAEELTSVALCFSYKDMLREAILLEIPSFVECNNASCPERLNLAKYFNENEEKHKMDNFHFPFKELNK